jgi:predicted HTH domain antitoxin
MVTVYLDDELVAAMQPIDDSIDRRIKELVVLDLLRQHAISMGKGAELLGMPLLDFIRLSGKHGIPYIDMSEEEWESEMRTLGLR